MNLWREILEVLKGGIDLETYKIWLRPTKFLRVEGNRLLVRVPNREFKEWIENTWGRQIQEILSAGEHGVRELQLVVEKSLERPPGLRVPAAIAGVKICDVRQEEVKWIWPGRLAEGKITVLDGDPGIGKSFVSLSIASRLSTGQPLPGQPYAAQPCSTIIMSAEDGTADTIKRRFMVAGGDESRLRVIKSIWSAERGEDLFTIPIHLMELQAAIESDGARLVVFDPFVAFLPRSTDTDNDHSIRRILFPLVQLAEKTRVAVVLIRHLSKRTYSNPLYAGGGSIGIVGAARIALLAGKSPDDPNTRVLAVIKNNLSQAPESLAYTIEGADGEGFVAWRGPLKSTATEMIQAMISGPLDRSVILEAEEFLTDLLRNGPKSSLEIFQAAKLNRISIATLRRAAHLLGINKRKTQFSGQWLWEHETSQPMLDLNGGSA